MQNIDCKGVQDASTSCTAASRVKRKAGKDTSEICHISLDLPTSNSGAIRFICRSNATAIERLGGNLQVQGIGFESFSDFSDVFREWSDAHKCALHMCAQVMVMQSGDLASSRNPQKMLAYLLTPRRSGNLTSIRNPSLMIQLKDWRLFDLERHMANFPRIKAAWEHGAPVRAAKDADWATDPTYAGLLPIMTTFEGLEMGRLDYIPLFRCTPHLTPLAASLAPIRDILLKDIMHLAVGSINAGFPLRPISESSNKVFPGRFIRDHRTWTWHQLFSDWTQYRRGQHKGLDETLAGLRSGFPPSFLIDAAHFLML